MTAGSTKHQRLHETRDTTNDRNRREEKDLLPRPPPRNSAQLAPRLPEPCTKAHRTRILRPFARVKASQSAGQMVAYGRPPATWRLVGAVNHPEQSVRSLYPNKRIEHTSALARGIQAADRAGRPTGAATAAECRLGVEAIAGRALANRCPSPGPHGVEDGKRPTPGRA
jgi:hypothetical protein